MNPFRTLADLASELRKQILHRYATDDPYTPEEAADVEARLKALAADGRIAARRMGCAGGEEVVDTLLQRTWDLFNARAQLRDPYSRANNLAAAIPLVAKLADDFDAESRRESRLTTETAGAPEGRSGGRPAKRTGRPRKGETDKQRLVISALATHHKWQGRNVENPTPAKTRHLAKLASSKHVKVSVATVSRFFKRMFPGRGYKGYEAACVRGEIGLKIALWQGEVSEEHLADLLPHESGREDDD